MKKSTYDPNLDGVIAKAQLDADLMEKSTYDPNLDNVIALTETEADMEKSVYDPNLDGVIAFAETEADMKKSVYDSDDDGIIDQDAIEVGSIAVTAGNIHNFANDAEVNTTSTVYIMKKAVSIPLRYKKGCVWRVSFNLKISSVTAIASARVYKNGVAVGVEQTHNGTSYNHKTQDLSFNGGDLLEVRLKISHMIKQAFLNEFRLRTAEVVLETW